MEPETLGENCICNILYGILFHIFDEGAVVSRYAEFRMTRPQIHVFVIIDRNVMNEQLSMYRNNIK